jgi:hypothetical protein
MADDVWTLAATPFATHGTCLRLFWMDHHGHRALLKTEPKYALVVLVS